MWVNVPRRSRDDQAAEVVISRTSRLVFINPCHAYSHNVEAEPDRSRVFRGTGLAVLPNGDRTPVGGGVPRGESRRRASRGESLTQGPARSTTRRRISGTSGVRCVLVANVPGPEMGRLCWGGSECEADPPFLLPLQFPYRASRAGTRQSQVAQLSLQDTVGARGAGGAG